MLANEITRCLEEDDQADEGQVAATAIRGYRSFGEALEVAQEYVIFDIADGE